MEVQKLCSWTSEVQRLEFFDVFGQLLRFFDIFWHVHGRPLTSYAHGRPRTSNFTLEKYGKNWTSLDVQELRTSMDVHGHTKKVKKCQKMPINVKKCQKMSKVVQGRQSRLLFCLLHMNCNRYTCYIRALFYSSKQKFQDQRTLPSSYLKWF